MYCTIPKHEVTTSFKWPLQRVGKHIGNNVTVFAIHKGADRMLDRLGKGAKDSFWNIPACFVDQYINWELYHNTLFFLACRILEHGNAGVPIDGCLSAPQSEIWAIWGEHQGLHEQTAETQTQWQHIIDSLDIDAKVVIPGVSRFHHLHHEPVHERFPNIWAHRLRGQAPDRQAHRQFGNHSCPATALRGPMESLFASITLDGMEYPIVHTTLWDGAPEGRSHAIINASPKRERHKLKKFLAQFELSDFLFTHRRNRIEEHRHIHPGPLLASNDALAAANTVISRRIAPGSPRRRPSHRAKTEKDRQHPKRGSWARRRNSKARQIEFDDDALDQPEGARNSDPTNL